jgi:hypothetical protein
MENSGMDRSHQLHSRSPVEIFIFLIMAIFVTLPIWLPGIFIGYELIVEAESNQLVRLLSGDDVPPIGAFEQLIQYLPYFTPAIFLYSIFFSGEKKGRLNAINTTGLVVREMMPGSLTVSWRPQGIMAHPVNNRKWRQLRPGVFVFQSTHDYRFYSYPLMVAGLILFNLRCNQSPEYQY